MFSVIGASFWKFVAIQQAIGMRLSLAKFLMDLCASTRRRPDYAIEQIRPATKASRETRKANLERRAVCSLLGAVDADLDGLAERRADLQVHPRQRGRLERRRGVAEERGQPVQRYCFGDCSFSCGVDFCVDYCFDFPSGDCCHLSAQGGLLARVAFFCVCLRVMALVLQPASRGMAVRCVVWVFASNRREGRELTWAARTNREISGKSPILGVCG